MLWVLVMYKAFGYGVTIDHINLNSKEACTLALHQSYDKAFTGKQSFCVNQNTGEVVVLEQ